MNATTRKPAAHETRGAGCNLRQAFDPVPSAIRHWLHVTPDRRRSDGHQWRLLLLVLLSLALSGAGCVSSSKAKLDAQKAYHEGQQKVLAEQQDQQPAVWFRGDIRNPRIPWAEGLTLSQALLAAHYTWSSNPRLITVTRDGELYRVNARLLLRGEDDPLLEPGDVIEVRH
jgi:hypothetical protein